MLSYYYAFMSGEYDEVERSLKEFDTAYDISAQIEKREYKQTQLNTARSLIDQAIIDGQWGDLNNATYKRLLAETYLDLAKEW